jgi:hypothetical protein
MFLQADGDFDLTPSEAMASRCRARAHPHELVTFPRFGATAMEAHQLWVHAPQMWAPVVVPFLDRWVRA